MSTAVPTSHLTAAEALQHGLVNRVVPAEVYLEEDVNAVYEMPLQAGLAYERLLFYSLFSAADQKEGMDVFINKRKPEWKGE
jgi:enoyl-CoA hydratase